jgi:hypothetical protein
VLAISSRPFLAILEPPSLKHLVNFFDHPQGNERAHSHIKIGAFSPPYRLLAKIFLHNLWPRANRSELVLKRAKFLYALVMRMPFCLCKHILQTMLEIRDEHSIGLPFVCHVTKNYLRFVTNIAETEHNVRVQDPLRSQTLMKTNAQLRFEGQGKAPYPPPVQGD